MLSVAKKETIKVEKHPQIYIKAGIYNLKTIISVYRLLFCNFMITTKQNSIIVIYQKKGNRKRNPNIK